MCYKAKQFVTKSLPIKVKHQVNNVTHRLLIQYKIGSAIKRSEESKKRQFEMSPILSGISIPSI
jgi:hypothetical protein